MGCEAEFPTLLINYSPKFKLAISLSRAEAYPKAGLPGYVEHFYDVLIKILHPGGHFEYQADGICFDARVFEHFAHELRSLQAGTADRAQLSEVGQMLSFKLEKRKHHLQASILVREYQPRDKETVLSAEFEVDYDLFVNKLAADILEFTRELKRVEPDQV